jgi:hypothetical protein
MMVGSLRFAVAAAFSLLLCACAGSPDGTFQPKRYAGAPHSGAQGGQVATSGQSLQCVPYARERSGVQLFGDAGSWWDLAAGHYARSNEPQLGAVLVLTGYAGPHRGHLAVVAAIESDRRIRVDHANWMNDGRVYRDDLVVDVSPNNDWSEVRVWDGRDNVLGVRTYLVRGFIGPGPDDGGERVASRD